MRLKQDLTGPHLVRKAELNSEIYTLILNNAHFMFMYLYILWCCEVDVIACFCCCCCGMYIEVFVSIHVNFVITCRGLCG